MQLPLSRSLIQQSRSLGSHSRMRVPGLWLTGYVTVSMSVSMQIQYSISIALCVLGSDVV